MCVSLSVRLFLAADQSVKPTNQSNQPPDRQTGQSTNRSPFSLSLSLFISLVRGLAQVVQELLVGLTVHKNLKQSLSSNQDAELQILLPEPLDTLVFADPSINITQVPKPASVAETLVLEVCFKVGLSKTVNPNPQNVNHLHVV